MATVEFQGLDTIIGVFSSLRANADKALEAAMLPPMQRAFNESQKQVPVATGVLKASGSLQIGDGEIVIGYGGAAAQYAVWVHENLQAHHRSPTKAKYVEDPMKAVAAEMRAVSSDVEGALLGQYPQAPSRAAAADAAAATRNAHPRMSTTRAANAMATSTAFTGDEISAALARASAHPGRMVRKRGA